jgi:hypothetical protein
MTARRGSGGDGSVDGAFFGYWGLLLAAGLACGLLNTLASSGSAVTLPILVLLGLPEGAANATNRLPVFVGCLIATATFARKGQLDWRAAARLAPPLAAGSVAGALLAEHLSDRTLGLLITAAVLLALLLLFTKIKDALSRAVAGPPQVPPLAVATMFGVGVWLGLIVLDGATYLLLVLILICSFPLPQANALKVLLITVGTTIAIAMFWNHGEVRWAEGAVLSLGSVVGGYLGVLASNMPDAKSWAFRMLVIVVTLELLHLGWHYTAPYRA